MREAARNSKLVAMLVILVSLGACKADIVNPSAVVSQQEFLYRREQMETGVETIARLDLRGNETVLLEGPPHAQITVSPSGAYAATLTRSGEMAALNLTSGTEIVHNLNPAEKVSRHIWGWSTADDVIFSEENNGYLTFYTLRISASTPQPDRNSELTQFFSWNMDEVQTSLGKRSAYGLFQFSPDFEYLLTPLASKNSQFESWSEEVSIWKVSDRSGKPLGSLKRVFPWWREVLDTTPVWSKRTAAITLFSDDSCPIGAYTYQPLVQPKLLVSMDCTPDNILTPTDMAWNPSGSQLAFWEVPIGDEPIRLKIASTADGAARTILENEGRPGSIYWSEDGQYLGAGTYTQDHYEIHILNPDTGALSFSKSFNQNQFLVVPLGWVAQGQNERQPIP